jgi:hypothetical protein
MDQFALSVMASLVAVMIVMVLERQRRPDLVFEIEPEPPVQPNGRKFLRVRVRNRPLPRVLGLVYERQPALMTRAWITFLHTDGQPVFRPGHRMRGRWADSPEPIRPVPVSTEQIIFLGDPFETWHDNDIPPGEFEVLDIVMRPPDSEQCYGWSSEYLLATMGAPEPVGVTFALDRGRYLVLVHAQAGGRSFRHVFRLVNDVRALSDFRLAEPDRQPSLPANVVIS